MGGTLRERMIAHLRRYQDSCEAGRLRVNWGEQLTGNRVFEAYYQLVLEANGSCGACCPYCGSICLADHRGDEPRQHWTNFHFLRAFRGWRMAHTQEPSLVECTDRTTRED